MIGIELLRAATRTIRTHREEEENKTLFGPFLPVCSCESDCVVMELANNSSNVGGGGGNLTSDPSLCLQDLVAGVGGGGSVDHHRSIPVSYAQHAPAHHHHHQLSHHHHLQSIQHHHHQLHHHHLAAAPGVHQGTESSLDLNHQHHVLNSSHHHSAARLSAAMNGADFMTSTSSSPFLSPGTGHHHHHHSQHLMGPMAAAVAAAATVNVANNHNSRRHIQGLGGPVPTAASGSSIDKIKRGKKN